VQLFLESLEFAQRTRHFGPIRGREKHNCKIFTLFVKCLWITWLASSFGVITAAIISGGGGGWERRTQRESAHAHSPRRNPSASSETTRRCRLNPNTHTQHESAFSRKIYNKTLNVGIPAPEIFLYGRFLLLLEAHFRRGNLYWWLFVINSCLGGRSVYQYAVFAFLKR
jgi:hypothetical protein